jgi:hypothetical protein
MLHDIVGTRVIYHDWVSSRSGRGERSGMSAVTAMEGANRRVDTYIGAIDGGAPSRQSFTGAT